MRMINKFKITKEEQKTSKMNEKYKTRAKNKKIIKFPPNLCINLHQQNSQFKTFAQFLETIVNIIWVQ